MHGKAPLGRLKRVELRDYWEREDTAFTPWLAQEDNIRLLGDAVGMDLEVVSQEVRVGPFRADILCKTPDGNHQVLIENQLGTTDHSHLGQLLTYAAGLEAVSIVWITRRFTEEHRAALDWLNRVTVEGVNFFGLEIELWRIGESPAAPKFNVISQPNEWVKTSAGLARSDGSLTPVRQLQLDFWCEFNAFLAERGGGFKPSKPSAQSWQVYAMGTSLFTLEAVVNCRDRWVGTRLSFPIAYYELISQDRDALAKAVGADLVWSEAKKVGVVLLSRGADVEARDSWPELHTWLVAYMESFASAFRSRAAEYKARLAESSEEA